MNLYMVKYRDLLKVKVKENKEPFVIIDQEIIRSGYFKQMSDMKKFLKNKIYVRKTVFQKLIKAQKQLEKINPSFFLYVCYGYRSPEIQKKLFLKQLRKISQSPFFPNPQELYEEIHQYIAVPTVAGHPTGGALDLLILNIKQQKFLDFGSEIYDFSTKKGYTFFTRTGVSGTAKNNRLLLRKIMIKNGFAPYDGEWWHFSYGDKEWAYYYKKSYTLYKQIPLNRVIV